MSRLYSSEIASPYTSAGIVPDTTGVDPSSRTNPYLNHSLTFVSEGEGVSIISDCRFASQCGSVVREVRRE